MVSIASLRMIPVNIFPLQTYTLNGALSVTLGNTSMKQVSFYLYMIFVSNGIVNRYVTNIYISYDYISYMCMKRIQLDLQY